MLDRANIHNNLWAKVLNKAKKIVYIDLYSQDL